MSSLMLLLFIVIGWAFWVAVIIVLARCGFTGIYNFISEWKEFKKWKNQ